MLALTKLEHLYICDTNIDSGLEYLSDSIRTLECSLNRSQNKVKVIEQELRKHGKPKKDKYGFENFVHLLQIWKKVNFKKSTIARQTKIEQLEKEFCEKQNNLKQIIISIKSKNPTADLQTFLRAQEEAIRIEDGDSQSKFEVSYLELQGRIGLSKIQDICQINYELIQLREQLEQSKISQVLQFPYGIIGSSK